MQGTGADILVAILAAMLIIAATGDLRARIIPNWLNATIAALAVPYWWLSGLPFWPEIVLQVALAVGIFTLFAALFAIGGIGGGDVKLIGALALWLPLLALVKLLVIMAVAGGLLSLAMLIRHRAAKAEGRPEVPYGVAIAFAGMWLIGERFLNQFG
jgi:prepilin peptidase CpaA